MCEVAEKLSAASRHMTREEWQPLIDLGVGEDALLGIAHDVGVFNHVTRLGDGFTRRLDEEMSRAAGSDVRLRRGSG